MEADAIAKPDGIPLLSINVVFSSLQIYHPSAEEKADPKLYAENVRRLMGAHLQAPCVDYGTRDEFLLKVAGVHIDRSGRQLRMKTRGMAEAITLAQIGALPALKGDST